MISSFPGVLGGPDITDVQRFHLRYRIELLHHLTGWYVHTLESIRRGSFVMEYSCEVLTETQAELRQLEYETIGNNDTQQQRANKFIMTIVQQECQDQTQLTEEQRIRRKVLNKIASENKTHTRAREKYVRVSWTLFSLGPIA